MENIVILGAGGHAKVVLDNLEEAGLCIHGIYDSNQHDLVFGYPYLGSSDDLVAAQNAAHIIAIGNNKARKDISSSLPLSTINAIHPMAFVSKRAKLGTGNMIMANTSVNAYAQIGNHVIINTNASVDHDCNLDDYVHISPQAGLAGNVSVGEGTHIGIGAQIIQNIKIGKWATIGAGAVIIEDVPDYAVVVGNPGRVIKFNYDNA